MFWNIFLQSAVLIALVLLAGYQIARYIDSKK